MFGLFLICTSMISARDISLFGYEESILGVEVGLCVIRRFDAMVLCGKYCCFIIISFLLLFNRCLGAFLL